MSAVFNIDAASYNEADLSPDYIEQWDSLSHLSLVTCLEEDFKIDILPEQIPRMKSYAAVVKILEDHGLH